MARRTRYGNLVDSQRQKLYDFERKHIWPLFPEETRTIKLRKPKTVTQLKTVDGRLEYDGQYVETHRKEAIKLTLPQCSLVIDWSLAHMGFDPDIYRPKIKDGRRNRKASANSYVVTLPLWSRTIPVVIHEVCHSIIGLHRHGLAWHGPEYCRVFFHLIAKTGKITEAELVKQAKAFGLKVAPTALIKEIRGR